MNSIPRNALTEAVEAGLKEAGLEPFEEAALRAFARTATAVSGNFDETPGCPAYQAGIWTPGDYGKNGALARFARAYDIHMLGQGRGCGTYQIEG